MSQTTTEKVEQKAGQSKPVNDDKADLDQEVGIPSSDGQPVAAKPVIDDKTGDKADLDQEVGIPSSDGQPVA
jgi:hypothetical protein